MSAEPPIHDTQLLEITIGNVTVRPDLATVIQAMQDAGYSISAHPSPESAVPYEPGITGLGNAWLREHGHLVAPSEDFTDQAMQNAAEILAGFKSNEPTSDATELDRATRKLEEYQACYAHLFRQLQPVHEENRRLKAALRQGEIPDTDGVREDLEQLIRVCLTNPGDAVGFIAANYPQLYAQALENNKGKTFPATEQPVEGALIQKLIEVYDTAAIAERDANVDERGRWLGVDVRPAAWSATLKYLRGLEREAGQPDEKPSWAGYDINAPSAIADEYQKALFPASPDERKIAFETWAKRHGLSLTISPAIADCYLHSDTRRSWEAWQAAYSLYHEVGLESLMPLTDVQFAERQMGATMREVGSLWQPIETAPKDGTLVLLWGSDKDVSPEAYARTSRWHECFWRGVGFNYSANATHWMPLPEPPAEAECSHEWTGQRAGGHPADADSSEWVGFCKRCGMEGPNDD